MGLCGYAIAFLMLSWHILSLLEIAAMFCWC